MVEFNRETYNYQISPDLRTQYNLRKLENEIDELSILYSRQDIAYHEEFWQYLVNQFWKKLYSNRELLSPDSIKEKLSPYKRLVQYFIRNGLDWVFKHVDLLWSKHRRFNVDLSDPVTWDLAQLYYQAWIPIVGKSLDIIEVPSWLAGGFARDPKKYGWKEELLVTIPAYNPNPDELIWIPSIKAWYKFQPFNDWKWTVTNELTHVVLDRFFPILFFREDHSKLTEPFKSFTSEIPWLRFQNNAQAAEFLSDVPDWLSWSPEQRFFTPLSYVDNKSLWEWKSDRYWYSYQVQKYAMIKVLQKKWTKNPEGVVNTLIARAQDFSEHRHDQLFVYAREFFQETDFIEIAKIYRRIWLNLLKKMRPYYQDN